MTLDERLQRAAHGVADRVEAPYVDLGAVRAGARDRTRRTQTSVVAVVVVMIAVAGVLFQLNRNAESLEPVTPTPGGVPVWYDAAGLHHGDVVEETPVEVWEKASPDLALVRSGALYRDPATDDVWFHPWAGEPRIVGRNSRAGPGGDPNGDLAAWFDGDELVVYDTSKGGEVSRNLLPPGDVVISGTGDHVNGGNLFRQVSEQQVVWNSGQAVQRLDLATGTVSELWNASGDGFRRELRDVHDDVALWSPRRGALEVTGTEGDDQRPAGLESLATLSADGAFVLAPWEGDGGEGHGAAIADVASGEVWKLPLPEFYAYVAWSYGDVALVLVERDQVLESFLACHATTQTCDRLPYDGTVTLPTS